MPDTQQVVITQNDVFDSILASMVLRGYKSINPYSVRQEPDGIIANYRYFDQACSAVYLKVKEKCAEKQFKCGFFIFLDTFFGTCDNSTQIIMHWMEYRYCYTRVPDDGLVFFDITNDMANDILYRVCGRTTLERQFYYDLTALFLGAYNGEQ